MKCDITYYIFLASFLFPSPAHSEEVNLETRFEEFVKRVNNTLTSQSNYLVTVYSQLAALEKSNKINPTSAIDNSSNNTIDQSLTTNALETLKNLSAKVELMDSVLNNFEHVIRKVETLSSSFDLMAKQVEGFADSLNDLQTDMDASKTVVEGMFLGTVGGAFAVSLPSLQRTRIAEGNTYPVAFDWTSRKVYWSDGPDGIKRANIDGTEAEVALQVYSDSIAVDSMSGNIYYGNVLSKELSVCSRDGEKCSVLAVNQSDVDDIVLHSSRRLMFWTNGTSIVRASMDGTNATAILPEKAWKISVDEDLDRLYWIDKDFEQIASMDLNGSNRRVLLKAATQLFAVAVHGDMVYFYDNKYNNVRAVGKHAGSSKVITTTNAPVYDIAFYGSKNANFRENPCENSPCAHVCVPKLRSFACLCPRLEQLDVDGFTCLV